MKERIPGQQPDQTQQNSPEKAGPLGIPPPPDQEQAPAHGGSESTLLQPPAKTPANPIQDKLDKLRKERESFYQSPLGKMLSKQVRPTEKRAGIIFDCPLPPLSPATRAEIEFRLHLQSMVDDGLITREEFRQRIDQFLESRKSEK